MTSIRGGDKDMVGRWQEWLKSHPREMQEKEILAGAVADTAAGADTVAATLQAFFYDLLRASSVQETLRGELDAAQKRGKSSDVVTYIEAMKPPFLQACAHSARRETW